MVLKVLGPESPEANVAVWERPCLELVQPEAAGGSSSSICSKHGFPPTTLQLIWGLRTKTVLIEFTVPKVLRAAHMISMVFEMRHAKFPEANMLD